MENSKIISETFYHYTNLDSAIKILLSNTVKFNSVKNCNDPFEFKWKCENQDDVDFIEKQKSTHFLFCASRIYDNILMWSHYADKHKGAVIGLNCKRYEGAQKIIGYDDNIDISDIGSLSEETGGGYHKGIFDLGKFYSQERYVQLLGNFTKEYPQHKIGSKEFKDYQTQKMLPLIFANIIRRKSKDWEYEQEMRFILADHQNQSEHFKNPNDFGFKISEIYLGCKMEERNKNIIRSLCEKLGIEFFETKESDSEYKIVKA